MSDCELRNCGQLHIQLEFMLSTIVDLLGGAFVNTLDECFSAVFGTFLCGQGWRFVKLLDKTWLLLCYKMKFVLG